MNDSELRTKLEALIENFSELSEGCHDTALDWAGDGHMDNAHIEQVRAIVYAQCANRLRDLLAEDAADG